MKPPSPSMRVGIIGAGRWGTIIAKKLRDLDGFRVVNVCDENATAAATLAAQVGANRMRYPSSAAQNVDAVIIATPPHTHLEVFDAVAEFVPRVRVEKPLAQAPGDALLMSMTARNRGVELTVGHTTCFQKAAGPIRRLINADTGPIIYGRLADTGPAHATTTNPVWDLMSHDVAFHRLVTHESCVRNPLRVVDVGWHDDLWSVRLNDGAAFVASWNSDRRVRGITGTGWAYAESTRHLHFYGRDVVFDDADPLARELSEWAQGRGYPAAFAVDVVAVCHEASSRIREVQARDGSQ